MDNLWNNEFKNSLHGTCDLFTEDRPIPENAEGKLTEYYSKRGLSESTRTQYIRRTRNGMRTLVNAYGPLRADQITEDMLRSLSDLRPDTKEESLCQTRTCIGRLVALFTGFDPWEERIRYFVTPGVVPCELCNRFAKMLIDGGRSPARIHKQLLRLENALRILKDNIPGFDIMDFGFSEIDMLPTYMIGMSDRIVREHQILLGRWIWMLTGRDPLRHHEGSVRRVHISDYLVSRMDLSGFREEIESFIQWNIDRGVKPGSVKGYVYSVLYILEDLNPFMPEGWRLEDVRPEHLVRVRMETVNVNEHTLRGYLSAFDVFLQFHHNNAFVEAKMLWNVDMDSMHRTWIDQDQWRRLMEIADPTDMVILALGGGMGLRRAEIANVKLSDIDGDNLRIFGKGHGRGKEVIKKIPVRVKAIIDGYLPYRQEVLSKWGDIDEDNLLITTTVRPGDPMTPDGIYKHVHRLGEKIGINVSPHTLRRLYATSLRDADVDLDTIRRMMRHSNLNTTLTHYLDLDVRRMDAANDTVDDVLFG